MKNDIRSFIKLFEFGICDSVEGEDLLKKMKYMIEADAILLNRMINTDERKRISKQFNIPFYRSKASYPLGFITLSGTYVILR